MFVLIFSCHLPSARLNEAYLQNLYQFLDKTWRRRRDPRRVTPRCQMGRLSEGDTRAGSRTVLAHRVSNLLGDRPAMVARRAGVAADQAATGSTQSARPHIICQPALPRCRSQSDQAGARL